MASKNQNKREVDETQLREQLMLVCGYKYALKMHVSGDRSHWLEVICPVQFTSLDLSTLNNPLFNCREWEIHQTAKGN